MRAIVFAGPSLPPAAHPSIEGVAWRPPVRQGDVYRAALAGPEIIAIIDGYFEVTPTVWHKEILWAMAQGIHVYGAASIGALRAAELDVFGMKGVGGIYEMFRDGVLQDDDEIAVLHGPEELGYPTLTEAMVNIRSTIDAAVRGDCLDAATAHALTAIAKELFYKQRTYDALLGLARSRGLPETPLARFAQWARRDCMDVKRADSLALLKIVRERLDGGFSTLRIAYEVAYTDPFDRLLRSRREA